MDFLVKPWEHQLKAFERAKREKDLALFFEMGTGKTATTINILRYRYGVEHRLMRTIILCPLITVLNWKREFQMHSKIAQSDIVPLLGPGAKRVKDFTHAATEPRTQTLTRPKIFITNYEAVEMEELVKLIEKWEPEILVCDESHRLKSHESKRAKTVVRISDLCKHRYILTGTPILNSAMDVYNQYRILDGGETFSLPDPNLGRRPMNFFEFRGIYFEDENRNMPANVRFPKWIPRPETYEQLNQKIYRKAIRVLKKDCLDLPPFIRQVYTVELGKDQARLYKEMCDEYIAWVHDAEKSAEPRAVVAQMALTKALRLQQIVSGFAKTEDGVIVPCKENPRIKALEELLEDIAPNHKVIVWSIFKENYNQIARVCEKLRLPFVEIHGGKTQQEKDNSEKIFRNDPDCRVMISNQRAGGVGINLVENKNIVKAGQCSYSIFYSKGFSLADDLQAEARNYRGGSEVYEKVTRIDLVAPGTIDELVLKALADKQNIADQVLKWTGAL